MSGIAGVYYFNRSDSLFANRWLGHSIQRVGPDGLRTKHAANITASFAAFHCQSDSRTAEQPLVSPTGEVLLWDGRLDNREDVIAKCGSRHIDDLALSMAHSVSGAREIADCVLVMAAWMRWKHNLVSELVGDFALSVWDPDAQVLFLARDFAGTRPLYYSVTRDFAVWSSELATFFALIPDIGEIDEEYVASYLILDEYHERTVYRGIHPVPPGAAVFINSSGAVQPRRYWKVDRTAECKVSSDVEYETEFVRLLGESVRCRMRSESVVMAELSGGLDSSSIVCIADRLRSTGANLPSLETASYLYDQSSSCDERRFICAVESQRRKVGHRLEDHGILSAFDDELEIMQPNPMHCFIDSLRGLSELMERRNSRVLLSGVGGDNLLLSETPRMPWFADLARQGKITALVRALAVCARFSKASYAELIRTNLLLPLLPLRIRLKVGGQDLVVPSWLESAFISRSGCRERLFYDQQHSDIPSLTLRARCKWLMRAISLIAQCYYRERFCVDAAFPFLHKPLVEFLLAVPVEQLVRQDEHRSLQRRALRDMLPESIRIRRDKPGPDEAVFRAVDRQWYRLSALFNDAHSYQWGFVNSAAFRSVLIRARNGLAVALPSLLRTISLELWLRARDRRIHNPSGQLRKSCSFSTYHPEPPLDDRPLRCGR